ncbi:hypothetical protein Cni_G20025 [Canna indica]|uniref:Uncharacterized protein n=1 Tax=Canna indica TaxID=4628 RepID=A0AAQ3QJ56_9LILI|nr:hypothetical protein Cni_G20025 [Canna indica]
MSASDDTIAGSPRYPTSPPDSDPRWACNSPKFAATEKVIELDLKSSITSEEDAHQNYCNLKLPEDKEEQNTISIVSSLRTELEKAHARIADLEAKQRAQKKKMGEKLAKEKATWRSRKHDHKVKHIIEVMQGDIDREKKKRQGTETKNAKLVSELAEFQLITDKLLQERQIERKDRALAEASCCHFVKEIVEYKNEIQTLKIDLMITRQEVEKEKMVLQTAEVWREERVKMKLIDTKLTLEEKYAQLRDLIAELQVFLAAGSDTASVREAELLKQRVDAAITEEIKFSYQPPPASEDVYAVFEEVRSLEETAERDMKACREWFHQIGNALGKVCSASGTKDYTLFDSYYRLF